MPAGATPMRFLPKPPSRARTAGLRLESILRRWGAVVVAVLAIVYYSLYYRSGLNFSGEGGTVAIVAMRLLEGQRPIVDTFLGYNVMWFYPVSWLFKLTGPDYTALRIFFFSLCTLTGVLAFLVVRRVSGNGCYSVLIALGPVLIPGMLFRNYMAFIVMLNMLVLLEAWVFEQSKRLRQICWMTAAGAVLGLTYLLRIDLGAFFTAMTAGLFVLYPFGQKEGFARRLRLAAGGAMVTAMMFCATHAPIYFDAVRRGYADAFVAQYASWLGMVRYLASQEMAKQLPSPKPASAVAEPDSPAEERIPVESKPRNRDVDSNGYLQKRSVTDVFGAATLYDRAFALATYLPVLAALLIVIAAGILLIGSLLRSNFPLRTDCLALLVST